MPGALLRRQRTETVPDRVRRPAAWFSVVRDRDKRIPCRTGPGTRHERIAIGPANYPRPMARLAADSRTEYACLADDRRQCLRHSHEAPHESARTTPNRLSSDARNAAVIQAKYLGSYAKYMSQPSTRSARTKTDQVVTTLPIKTPPGAAPEDVFKVRGTRPCGDFQVPILTDGSSATLTQTWTCGAPRKCQTKAGPSSRQLSQTLSLPMSSSL